MSHPEPDAARVPGEPAVADREAGAARRRVVPVHPLLFAAFPVLALYAHNIGELQLQQIVRPLGAYIAGALVVWAVAAAALRHIRKGAACASAAVLVFSTYGHIVNLLNGSDGLVVLAVCILAVGGVALALARSRGTLAQLTTILNLTAVVLVAPSAWAIGADQWRVRSAAQHGGAGLASASQGAAARRAIVRTPIPKPARPDLPDVYYIILDAYARDDSLRTFYSFDNAPFLSALEKRGFYVARGSRSNYDETPLSLACSLNMAYLDPLAARLGPTSDDTEPLRDLIDRNAVAAFLRPLGYHYVYVWTGASQTRLDTPDVTLAARQQITNFEGQVLGLSALDASRRASRAQYAQHRRAILAGFDNLAKVAELRYPKFVLVHILAPHPPFVFGAQGEEVNSDRGFSYDDGSWLLWSISRDRYRADYVAQLRYVNRRVLAALDSILSHSRVRPIIVIQGDHGSRMNMDWDNQEKTDLREPFSILNAYLVPQKVRDRLYPTITPVNSFRLLLTHAYGASLPPLPDRTYYSTAATPYAFTDVTRLIPPMTSVAASAGDTGRGAEPGTR